MQIYLFASEGAAPYNIFASLSITHVVVRGFSGYRLSSLIFYAIYRSLRLRSGCECILYLPPWSYIERQRFIDPHQVSG